jgi:hypothetical protein
MLVRSCNEFWPVPKRLGQLAYALRMLQALATIAVTVQYGNFGALSAITIFAGEVSPTATSGSRG